MLPNLLEATKLEFPTRAGGSPRFRATAEGPTDPRRPVQIQSTRRPFRSHWLAGFFRPPILLAVQHRQPHPRLTSTRRRAQIPGPVPLRELNEILLKVDAPC